MNFKLKYLVYNCNFDIHENKNTGWNVCVNKQDRFLLLSH